MKIVPIDVPELGNRSYIVHDGVTGVVFDPSRRSQELIDKATAEGVQIKAVFETHIHNDYVTGGYALATKLGAPYYVSAQDKVSFEREEIKPEQTVEVGTLRVTALASPGHTFHHLSYLVEQDGETPALFSGGSLLYGAVGRPDLVSAEATLPLAKAQYQTAQFYIERLTPETLLYPTHGFGSFCAATETESVAVSTIKHQLEVNQAYTSTNEDEFVSELVANLDAYPSYYAHMAPANIKGPLDPDLEAPEVLTREAVMRALHEGAAIIDMRSHKAYAAEHLPGTYNVEMSNSLATYVGWIIAWEAPLVVVAETAEEVLTAREQLSLIGREIVAGQVSPKELLKSTESNASYPLRSFSDLANEPNALVLDVRRKGEWNKDHIKGSLNIPLHELSGRMDEVSGTQPVWVHCLSSFRASIAASMLSGAHKQVVLVDDIFANAVKAGLTIEKS